MRDRYTCQSCDNGFRDGEWPDHPGHYYHDLMHVDHWLAYGPGVVDEFVRLGYGTTHG